MRHEGKSARASNGGAGYIGSHILSNAMIAMAEARDRSPSSNARA
jgi:hypothetical protein